MATKMLATMMATMATSSPLGTTDLSPGAVVHDDAAAEWYGSLIVNQRKLWLQQERNCTEQ